MTFSFRETVLLGLTLTQALLLVFVWVSENVGDKTRMFLSGMFVWAFWFLGKYLYDMSKMGDLYHVGRDVLPGLLVKFYSKHVDVSPSQLRTELYHGYYLYEYQRDGIVVAWHPKKGVVAHERTSLKDFKKEFKPNDVNEESLPVVTEKSHVEVGEVENAN